MSENTKLALLIDGDNVSVSLIPQILNEIIRYAKPLISKVYLNNASLTSWQSLINEHSLHPVWIPNNTARKNAADIALVIDAMEILYERTYITDFCIVSSDSDFTQLARYIISKNKIMLGIGEDKTPISFVNACTTFFYMKDLLKLQLPLEQPKTLSNQKQDKPDDTQTKQFETLFIQAYENAPKDEGGWVQLLVIKGVMNGLDVEFQASSPPHRYLKIEPG